eukprot:15367182-Ditylum_brightwellii.AAC.3
MAKADTGAICHYWMAKDENVLENVQNINNGPKVTLPDSTTIQANKKGTIFLHPALSTEATPVHAFPHLTNAPLLSVGQLYDDNCAAIFNREKLLIYKGSKTEVSGRQLILKGKQNGNDGLWDVLVPTPHSTNNTFTTSTTESLNVIIRKDKTKTKLVHYLYACAFIPPTETLQKAIHRGHFISWPGVEDINFMKLVNTTKAMASGHLDQERQNLQSIFSPMDSTGEKQYGILSAVVPFHPKERHF